MFKIFYIRLKYLLSKLANILYKFSNYDLVIKRSNQIKIIKQKSNLRDFEIQLVELNNSVENSNYFQINLYDYHKNCYIRKSEDILELSDLIFYLKKVALLNFHISFYLLVKLSDDSCYNTITTCSSFALNVPSIHDVEDYCIKNLEIIPEFTSKIEMIIKNIKISLLLLVQDIPNSQTNNNLLDFIIFKNKIYDNSNLTLNILENKEIFKLFNTYGIEIVETTNINNIKIKTSIKKNLVFVIDIEVPVSQSSVQLTENDFFEVLRELIKQVRKDHIFLFLEPNERKTLKLYEKDLNIISDAILFVALNSEDSEMRYDLIELAGKEYDKDQLDIDFSESMKVIKNGLNHKLYVSSLK